MMMLMVVTVEGRGGEGTGVEAVAVVVVGQPLHEDSVFFFCAAGVALGLVRWGGVR